MLKKYKRFSLVSFFESAAYVPGNSKIMKEGASAGAFLCDPLIKKHLQIQYLFHKLTIIFLPRILYQWVEDSKEVQVYLDPENCLNFLEITTHTFFTGESLSGDGRGLRSYRILSQEVSCRRLP